MEHVFNRKLGEFPEFLFPLQSAKCLLRLKGRYHRVNLHSTTTEDQPLPAGTVKKCYQKWTAQCFKYVADI